MSSKRVNIGQMWKCIHRNLFAIVDVSVITSFCSITNFNCTSLHSLFKSETTHSIGCFLFPNFWFESLEFAWVLIILQNNLRLRHGESGLPQTIFHPLISSVEVYNLVVHWFFDWVSKIIDFQKACLFQDNNSAILHESLLWVNRALWNCFKRN